MNFPFEICCLYTKCPRWKPENSPRKDVKMLFWKIAYGTIEKIVWYVWGTTIVVVQTYATSIDYCKIILQSRLTQKIHKFLKSYLLEIKQQIEQFKSIN